MTNTYSKSNPFFATIKERYSLCKSGSKKNTQHIVLNLKGSGITYDVGDSIAIFPQNDPNVVLLTLKAMHATGKEIVTDRNGENPSSLYNFLSSKANITDINRKLFSEITARQSNFHKKTHFESLLTPENKEAFKQYLAERHVWDILIENPEVAFTPQELCGLLLPLLPRFYSIASSQNVVGDEVHLTVALLKYHANGHQRLGVCTNYLCNLAPVNEPIIPIYIQSHHGFTVPSDLDTRMIMIGPGTGIAPFRAFMQERIVRNASGDHWLFFGEWNKATDFLYEDLWKELSEKKKLKLDLAFSRDQEYKIYVQHRMLEHGAEFFRWIDSGAHIYVCGDAHRMAKDVEAALLQIFRDHGNHNEQSAKEYLKKLRTEKRYLRDVY